MPIMPTYPGVYIEEIPSGVRTITGVATSITAFVGYTAQGPLNKATRIFNFGDYERTFGGLHRDSEISYSLQQFFANGGSDAYVVRVASGAAPALVSLEDANGDVVLNIKAANPGVWGNFLRLDVDYATRNPDSYFNLTVTRYELRGSQFVPVESEQYQNLSLNSQSNLYAHSVVNNSSKLLYIDDGPEGLTFINQGFSLSGDLSSFPALSATTSTLTGILDGADSFTVVLTTPPTDLDELVTALNSAITAAGLNTRLQAGRANPLGDDDANGNHIKLISSAQNERSDVRLVVAPTNDAARSLKLGLANGGREFDGASSHRPVMTGTSSGDLSELLETEDFTDDLTVTITDESTTPPTTILASTTLNFPTAVRIGTALRDALQTRLRAIDNPATRQARVELSGRRLRVVPSANTPNAVIRFSGAGAGTLLLNASAVSENVQQYSVGTGAAILFQSGASPGADGNPPGAVDLIGSFADKTGIYALRDVDIFNLLVLPLTTQLSETEASSVLAAAVTFCEEERAFLIIDPDPSRDQTTIADWAAAVTTSRNAAVFFPLVEVADPLDNFRPRAMPPSGMVAGIFARTDSQRGVWKAAAGTTDGALSGVVGLKTILTDQENGVLNPLGVNVIRRFPVYNIVVWGARTRRGAEAQADEYKYIPVRRLALFLEESLYRGTQWVVFEPNDEPLWAQIRLNVGAFMNNLFRQGAFQGKTPREAYLVKCDKETTTQNDIDRGIVNILVGFAPLKPAEFVFIKLQQLAGQIQT